MNEETQVTDITATEVANEATTDDANYAEAVESLKAENKKLQQAMTRQGYELGELRKLKPMVDKLLVDQTKTQEPVDFFSDPRQAVAQEIEQHPRIQALQNEQEALRQQRMLLQLKESHPDFQDVAKDAGFQEWVQSSKIRTRLFQDADHSYDFDAANELLTTWKERKTIANTTKAEQELKAKSEGDMKAAKVHTGSGVTGKKIYSRLEIMNLKTRNPDAYAALNVNQLYAEGRVR